MCLKFILRHFRKEKVLLTCLCLFTIHNFHLQSVNYVLLPSPIKAMLYRVLNIPTNTKIYLTKSQNIIAYSPNYSRYLVNNEDICSENYPLVLIFVKVHAADFEARKVIRETWGNVTSWKKFGVRDNDVVVLFSLGTSKQRISQIQAAISRENEKFHDIIQENYIENFHNLTLKVVGQLKWPLTFCRRAMFWMSTDSDVFVQVGNLVSHLKKQNPQGFYSGLVHTGAHRISDPLSKYFVSDDVYKGVYYPDYCPGGGYILSMDVVKRFFENVPSTPLMHIDDIYVGLLANACGIKPVHYVMLMGENRASTDLCTLSKFLTSHGHTKEEMRKFYNDVLPLSGLNPDVVCWNKYLSWINPFDLVIF